MAVRSNKKKVTQEDFDEAIEKSVAGLQRKSRILNEDERKKVAYHEVGHALTAHMTEGHPPSPRSRLSPGDWELPRLYSTTPCRQTAS